MNKRIGISILLLVGTLQYAMEQSSGAIANASYFVIEGDSSVIGGTPEWSRFVTYYTATGDKLVEMEHRHAPREQLATMLDKSAPKPQPARCEIRYWPALRGFRNTPQGESGDFIMFHDKTGNKIASYRFTVSSELDDFDEILDVSKIKEAQGKAFVDMREEDYAQATRAAAQRKTTSGKKSTSGSRGCALL